MTRWYAFNGDADGLCALQQLRLADPAPSRLVTGVKRDIQLARRLECAPGDEATILDIALDQNRDDVWRLLESDVTVRYFDHHHPGNFPTHARFHGHIDTAADVCTSILVDRHLGGRYAAWAIVAAFGDGLEEVAGRRVQAHGYGTQDGALLRRLGVCLNYNAYGESIADLHCDPAQLAEAMRPFRDPLKFARDGEVFARLSVGYEEDMDRARALRPVVARGDAMLVLMPSAPWARRAIGVYANELAQRHPASAVAILVPQRQGDYTVSVRVPPGSMWAADQFCRQFPTGGGRRGAAGINRLPAGELEQFTGRFVDYFRS